MKAVTLELSTRFHRDRKKKTLKKTTRCNKTVTKMYLINTGGETQRCIGSSIEHLLVWKRVQFRHPLGAQCLLFDLFGCKLGRKASELRHEGVLGRRIYAKKVVSCKKVMKGYER